MSRAIVADASVVVAVLTDEGAQGARAAAAIRDRSLHAPSLMPYEVVHVLRGHESRGRLSPRRANGAVGELFRAGVEFAPLEGLVDRVWELRHNLTAYDASYVALAERLDVPLITLDHRLARAPGLRCEVIVPA